MKEAVIVSGVRTAVGKSGRGSLVDEQPEDMGAAGTLDAFGMIIGVSRTAFSRRREPGQTRS